MNTNVVVHSAALSNVNTNSSLREGSSVYVRILKNVGNNSYVAAFAGGKFLLKSEISLKEGAEFFAKIKLSAGKIILQKIEKNADTKNSVQKITVENQKQFLENLGLFPDKISFSMFQQMKLLGVRFEKNLFQKARKISEKFKGKEKTASDAAFIMEKKGILSDEEKVCAVLQNGDAADNFSYNNGEKFSGSGNCVSYFFKNLLSSSELLKNQPGILTLFNHLGFDFENAKTNGSWIKIPFEFSSEEICGNGSFCGFLQNKTKTLEKAVLTFYEKDARYIFEFGLSGNNLSYLNYICSDGSKNHKIAQKLKNQFKNIKINQIDEDAFDFSEFSADNSEILVARIEA